METVTKRINKKRFKNSFGKAKSFIKSFPGAKIQEPEHFVVPHLDVQKPDVSIKHTGGKRLEASKIYM